MRKGFLAAAIAGLLVAAYAAAGHWLAPRLVRDALVERASRLGLELRLGDVRTDPFAFRVALSDIQLFAADGHALASAQSASADLAWASLWRSDWVVQSASLHQPSVEIALGPDGRSGWPVAGNKRSDAPRRMLAVQHLVVSEGTVSFIDRSRGAPVALKLLALHLQLKGLSRRSGDPTHYEMAAQIVGGGTVSSQGSISLEPLAGHGKLAVAGAALPTVWQLAAPGAPAGRGQLDASAAYAYERGRLVLEEVSLTAAHFSYAGIALQHVALAAPKLVIPSNDPFQLTAKANVEHGGSVAARGSVGLQPLTADLRLEVADVALAQAQSWLPAQVAVKIVSGALSANGRLRVQEGDTSYEGSVAVRDARLDELDSGKLLLGWKSLESNEAKLRFAPFGAEIGELVVRAPRGRLDIEADRSVTFAQAYRRQENPNEADKPLPATLRRLRIEDGTLEFADRSLDSPFAVSIRELSGSVTGLSTARGDPARIQLQGRVAKYGSARIRGTLNLQQPKTLANLTATFRNLDLAPFTPYAAKFAGYRIDSGRLSAELRYQVRDGRLTGSNQLTIEQMQLGARVESASASEVPLELAVALLSDSKGRIDLDIPVIGNLNDPQFDFGGLIAKAIGNVVGKLASAPFRALGALFGGEQKDLGQVRFEPGSAALTPPQEENVAEVAKALGERPQLGVAVRGGYDPETDVPALGADAVRREISRRARYEAEKPLDFQDPKVLHAAENLYLERVGNRLELQRLRESEPRYGRALIEKLSAARPVEPGRAEALARTRAETVREALLEGGVDPSRVRLEAPASEPAGKEGVPTALSLGRGGQASTGATGR
jgi:outer membrane protein OmpA-like peptidoglycan-associated protein